MTPYALLADIHFHNWTAFSSANADGVNSRLAIQCAEMLRAAQEIKKLGGDCIAIAGDIFHVRGSLAPSVLNPVIETVKEIVGMGIRIIAIPGNHDLEGRDATRLGNAVRALEAAGVEVMSEPGCFGGFAFAPWQSSIDALMMTLEDLRDSLEDPWNHDLIIHAPIDGVIPGLPAHGLTAEALATLGFRRVFAGHYHDHKQFDRGVYSIGATTQQNWGDVGTRAGYLIVADTKVVFRASHAPKFIDITPETDPAEIPLEVDGNYVRLKLEDVTDEEVNAARRDILGMGALGVTVNATRKTEVTRTGASAKSGATLESSVAAYVAAKGFDNHERVAVMCDDILREVRAE